MSHVRKSYFETEFEVVPRWVIKDSPGFWILHCGFQISSARILDSLSVELGFPIPIVRKRQDSKALDSGFHMKRILG